MSKECDIDFKNNCMGDQNARCVSYQGSLSEKTELNTNCKIHTVHEVLEDTARQFDDIYSQLDMTGVDMSCFDLDPNLAKIPEIIEKIIAKQCNPDSITCDNIFNTPLDCIDIDYKCLYSECGEALPPQNFKELFQAIIDKSCEEVEVSGQTVVEGSANVDVTSQTVGNTTTYTVYTSGASKSNFYEKAVETVTVSSANYDFPNSSYSALTFENTTSSTKDYKVDVSVSDSMHPSTGIGYMSKILINNLHIGIIKTDVSSNDTVEYDSDGNTSIELGYIDGSNSIPLPTGEYVETTPSGLNAVPTFINSESRRDRSIFAKVTLAQGEKVSLKFKSSPGDFSILHQAQIFIQEL